MNIIIEEVETSEVVSIEISDAVSYFDIIEVSDASFEGKNGYVPTVNEVTGKIELKEPSSGTGGATNADNVTETATRVFVTPAEKTAITHSNRNILDAITESFTTALKNGYDNSVSWITTNGTNVVGAYNWILTNGSSILNHIISSSNPHNVTKSQVGLSNVDNVQQYPNSNPDGFEGTTALNARDTNNRNRSNHTGSQLAATISDFASASRLAIVSNQLSQNNITFKNPIGDYFGKVTAPRTGTLTFDTTDAVTGGIAIVYYNNATLDIPSVWLTVGDFIAGEINKLYFERDSEGYITLNILNAGGDVTPPSTIGTLTITDE